MATFFLVSLLLLLSVTNSKAQESCSNPIADCKNGVWSRDKCECQCIPPFCPGQGGACIIPGGNCSGNPFVDCTPGANCPWWNDVFSAGGDACKSGPSVPPGIWEIYGSEQCCLAKERDATKGDCGPDPALTSLPPTKKPTTASAVADAFNNGAASEGNQQQQQDDALYEMVPIKFAVNGLPSEVNMRELKEEMLIVLKRILTDLADRVQGLKISNVEENLVLTVGDNGGDGMTADGAQNQNNNNNDPNANRKEVFYDVTVVRQPNKPFGPIIIAGLRDSYDIILEEIEEYTNMKYFGIGLDLDWCTSDEVEGSNNIGYGGQQQQQQQGGVTIKVSSFGICSRNHEIVKVKFRLANIPPELDLDKFIPQMKAIYMSLLEDVNEKLEIVDIEDRVTINLNKKGEIGEDDGIVKDVFFDIIVVRKFDTPDFGPAINNKLKNSKNEVLNQIQSHTDSETDLDLNWCIDDKNAYAVCPLDEESERRFALPNWAIIALTVVSVVLVFCICYCIMSYVVQREESKNERNMASYIATGQNYSKRNDRSYMNKRPPEPPHRRRRRRQQGDPNGYHPNKYVHRHSDHRSKRPRRRPSVDRQRRPQSQKPKRKQKRRSSSRPDRKQDHLDAPPKHRHKRITSGREPSPPRRHYYLEAPPEYRQRRTRSPSQSHSEDEDTEPTKNNNDAMRKKNTEYEYEQMPTFIFNDGNDGDNAPRHLSITNGDEDYETEEELTERPSPRGEHIESAMVIENGEGWFIDEESIDAANRRA